jgi:hypothetical protein
MVILVIKALKGLHHLAQGNALCPDDCTVLALKGLHATNLPAKIPALQRLKATLEASHTSSRLVRKIIH